VVAKPAVQERRPRKKKWLNLPKKRKVYEHGSRCNAQKIPKNEKVGGFKNEMHHKREGLGGTNERCIGLGAPGKEGSGAWNVKAR